MNRDILSFIDKYVKEIKDNSAAMFIGAGFSKSAGYVDWKNLLRNVAEDLDLDIDKEYDGAWGSGNEVPLSAVVVGNRSASYQYPTTINFADVKITAPEANMASKAYFEMYVYQNDETNTVSASGTVESTNEYTVNTESMNGASYTVTLKTAEV